MIEMKNRNTIYLRIVNLFAFIAMVLMNVLSETLPLNGVTTAEVSDRYVSLFTPAGLTFAIWFVIYSGLAYFTIWQLTAATDEDIERIGMSFALSCALNILWLVLWHFDMIYLATIVILALLVNLYDLMHSTSGENFLVRSVFSVYLAWITVASIASLFIAAGKMFDSFALGTFAQILVWAAILMILFLTYMRLRNGKDYAYALTMIWAIAGVGNARISAGSLAIGFDHILLGVLLALVLILVMIELTVSGTIRKDPIADSAS